MKITKVEKLKIEKLKLKFMKQCNDITAKHIKQLGEEIKQVKEQYLVRLHRK